jgi:hypothetical protein
MGRGKASALLPACAAAMTVFGAVLAAVPAQADGDQGAAVLSQINATRAANGCGLVAANPQLTASAVRHASRSRRGRLLGHRLLRHPGYRSHLVDEQSGPPRDNH